MIPFEIYGGDFRNNPEATYLNDGDWEWVSTLQTEDRIKARSMTQYTSYVIINMHILKNDMIMFKLRKYSHIAIVYPKLEFVSVEIYERNGDDFDLTSMYMSKCTDVLDETSWINTTFPKGDIRNWLVSKEEM